MKTKTISIIQIDTLDHPDWLFKLPTDENPMGFIEQNIPRINNNSTVRIITPNQDKTYLVKHTTYRK